jgi:radical SAM protein with 4Fe4S-binding SPASM domain
MSRAILKNLKALPRGLATLAAYARGAGRAPLPSALWIEPTNRCNLRCVMCPTRLRAKEKTGFMELAAYRAIIDEVSPFLTTGYLFLGGESLLHRDLPEMLRYAHRRGVAVRLNTNATLLTRERGKELIAAGLEQITFSFDGCDAASYESVRVGGKFEETLENVLGFLRLKREMSSRLPFAILQNIIVRSGPETGPAETAFRERFRGLPLDAFVSRVFHSWRGIYQDSADFRPRRRGPRYVPCTYIWCSAGILWDGTVVPCCLDADADYPLGKVGERPFSEIWNGEKARELRRAIHQRRHGEIRLCAECDILWPDRTLRGFPYTLVDISLLHPLGNLAGFRLVSSAKRVFRR